MQAHFGVLPRVGRFSLIGVNLTTNISKKKIKDYSRIFDNSVRVLSLINTIMWLFLLIFKIT